MLPHKRLKNTWWYINNLLLSCIKQINYLSLSRIGLQLSHTREAIKRESGVNPEQSRCCKFHTLRCEQPTFSHWKKNFREGARNRNKSEDLPCNQFHCFRGKSVESNEPDNSVYHFIHHSDSEKVCCNKLCQKFIYACPVEGISPGHF